MILVHVTSEDRVSSILANGLRGPSCWTNNEAIVATYTIVQMHHGRTPAWLITALELFDESVLHPDLPSIFEPVEAALNRSDDEIADQWLRAPSQNWYDSLRIVHSLIITTHIPPHFLQIAKSPKNLMYELQTQGFPL